MAIVKHTIHHGPRAVHALSCTIPHRPMINAARPPLVSRLSGGCGAASRSASALFQKACGLHPIVLGHMHSQPTRVYIDG